MASFSEREQEVYGYYRRFRAYNKLRIERSLSLMPAKKRPLFYLFPVLLHINHPDIPGYVESSKEFFGVANFEVTKIHHVALG